MFCFSSSGIDSMRDMICFYAVLPRCIESCETLNKRIFYYIFDQETHSFAKNEKNQGD